MTQQEIETRRHQLAAEYLALENASSTRGFEIAHEFGVLAELENRHTRFVPTSQDLSPTHSNGRRCLECRRPLFGNGYICDTCHTEEVERSIAITLQSEGCGE